MKNMLFPLYQSTARRFFGGALMALSLMVSPTLQAQTNFNFNDSTAPGWGHWLPEFYGTVDDGNGNFTNASNLPTVTFTTNDSSAGNMAYYFHAGTTNSVLFHPPMMGSFITNGAALNNFTMTGEFFHWTNGQSQSMGLVGLAKLPWPPVNAPNTSSTSNSFPPAGLMLNYENARSAKNFRGESGSGDRLALYWMDPLGNRHGMNFGDGINGPGAPYTVGGSLSPDSTNGHYRMILTANNVEITAQMVDLSTGLPMTWSTQNIIRRGIYYSFNNGGNLYEVYLTNNGAIFINGSNPGITALGAAYGFSVSPADHGFLGPVPGDPTRGQPLDPHFDNFAIVPGVVTLESAAAVNGPYTQDTTAGIEVNPKRITVPTNGSARFYRINWIDADHTPTITSVTLGGPVSVVTAATTSTLTTNVVRTVVLTYN